MPVAMLARPLPSTLTERAICVSVVLRSAVAERGGIAVSFSAIAYTKSALGERFRERGKASPILLRRPDGEPDAMIEQRHAGMQVLHEHAAAPHALEDSRGVGNANQDEIRVAWKNGYVGQLAQQADRRNRFSKRREFHPGSRSRRPASLRGHAAPRRAREEPAYRRAAARSLRPAHHRDAGGESAMPCRVRGSARRGLISCRLSR